MFQTILIKETLNNNYLYCVVNKKIIVGGSMTVYVQIQTSTGVEYYGGDEREREREREE